MPDGRWYPAHGSNCDGDPEAWAASEFAEIFPKGSYRSQWYRIDRDRGVLVAFGIHGKFIYIHRRRNS